MNIPFCSKIAKGLLLLLVACGPQPVAGDELWGNSLEMIRSDGGRALVMFGIKNDMIFKGVMHRDAMTGSGTYSVLKGRLCYRADFPGQECWIYTTPLQMGQPTTLISQDGSLHAVVTLHEGHSARTPI